MHVELRTNTLFVCFIKFGLDNIGKHVIRDRDLYSGKYSRADY